MSGYWMGYFAGRAAPLGAMTAAPVESMFFSFPDRRVARALPEAWACAEPGTVLEARITTARLVLADHLREVSRRDLDTLASYLEMAADGCHFAGRPLAAGWSSPGRTHHPGEHSTSPQTHRIRVRRRRPLRQALDHSSGRRVP